MIGDVDLERRNTCEGAGWRPDLGWELRECRQVVPEQGTRRGEPVTGELHTVAGVTGETDDDSFDFADLVSPVDSVGHVSPFTQVGGSLNLTRLTAERGTHRAITLQVGSERRRQRRAG